jgi:hypothetical protein
MESFAAGDVVAPVGGGSGGARAANFSTGAPDSIPSPPYCLIVFFRLRFANAARSRLRYCIATAATTSHCCSEFVGRLSRLAVRTGWPREGPQERLPSRVQNPQEILAEVRICRLGSPNIRVSHRGRHLLPQFSTFRSAIIGFFRSRVDDAKTVIVPCQTPFAAPISPYGPVYISGRRFAAYHPLSPVLPQTLPR